MTASTYETVTQVIDGETFLTRSRRKPVRLANVYAPAGDTEPGAKAARQLRGLIGGKRVEVIPLACGDDGIPVARVKVNGKSINLAMNDRLQ